MPIGRACLDSGVTMRLRPTPQAPERACGPSQPRPPMDRRMVVRALGILRRAAGRWKAPVLSLIAAERGDPFLTLVGCLLSLRTKDETTALAASRLFARARTPGEILKLSLPTLERLIYPVGFYRTKARVIRGVSRDVLGKFGGRVPDDVDELLKLKGVGRKTANLVVSQAYGRPAICVDTHVHRISNRWGLVRTKRPDKTEAALSGILPRSHWAEYNALLVAFGQTICQPLSPWCSRCPVEHLCPRIAVTRSR